VKAARVCPRVQLLAATDLFTNELLVRNRSLNLESTDRLFSARRVSRRAAASLVRDLFTNELLGRGRGLTLDRAQSLVKAARDGLRTVALVIGARFTNELFIRGRIRVVLNAGSRTRAAENAGWRNRAFEKVRCGVECRTALVPRYPGYVVVLCGAFLCAGLYGICAPAVSASVKLPIQTKRLRFIISPLFNFVNQTPAISGSCAGRGSDL
jgi:hypothetical protein